MSRLLHNFVNKYLRNMKRLLFILFSALALVALNSCHAPFSHVTYYVDYQQAGKGKVFITEANSVSFEYEPLGTILVEEVPGSVKVTVPTTEKERAADDGLYGPSTSKTVTTYSQATAQTALNYAAEKAIELGGNGLINVRLSSYLDNQKRRVVQVTGMVIKRP